MMESIILSKHSGGPMASIESRYRSLPLIDLIREIADKGDIGALHEFHNNRQVFSYNNGPPMVLVEFLIELRESVLRGGSTSSNAFEAADKAYDLTLAKFNNYPSISKPAHSINKKNGEKLKQEGPNCRLYYRAYLKRCIKSFNKNAPKGELEREIRAANIMQGLVRRQFHFSLLEAERRLNPFRSRYSWEVNGGTFTVYLPVTIKGLERRKWLEENIENPDPFREEERERIQAIINRSFVNYKMAQIEDAQNLADQKNSSSYWEGDDSEPSLSEVVAQEKADNIEKQRPAIRALGKEKLKKLILRIFDDLDLGEYKDCRIASEFRLSKSTFSRFAGSKWKNNDSALPDLFMNIALLLSTNTALKEMARETGFMGIIQQTLERGAQSNMKGPQKHD